MLSGDYEVAARLVVMPSARIPNRGASVWRHLGNTIEM